MNIAKSFLEYTDDSWSTYDDIFDYEHTFYYVLYIQPKISQEPGIIGNSENITIKLSNPYLYVVSNFIEMLDAIKNDKEYSLFGWAEELYYKECKIKYYKKEKEYLVQTGKEECIECVTQIINAFKITNKWKYKIELPHIYIANNNSQVCLKIGSKFKINEFNKILEILNTGHEHGYRKKFGNVTIECFRSLERPGLYIQIKKGKNMVSVIINRNDAYLLITGIIQDLGELA